MSDGALAEQVVGGAWGERMAMRLGAKALHARRLLPRPRVFCLFGVALFGVVCTTGAAPAQAAAAALQVIPRDTTIARLTSENIRLAASLDSLRNDLAKHRYAEEFYSVALEEQANRFALIIASLLVIVGGITFAGFRQEVRRLEEELRDALNKQAQSAREVERRVAGMESFTRRTAGNTYSTLASLYESRQNFLRSVSRRLLAAGNFYASNDNAADTGVSREGPRKAALANLGAALKAVRSLESVDRARVADYLGSQRPRFQEAFELLRRHADPEADNVIAEIRVALHTYLSEQDKGRPVAGSGSGLKA